MLSVVSLSDKNCRSRLTACKYSTSQFFLFKSPIFSIFGNQETFEQETRYTLRRRGNTLLPLFTFIFLFFFRKKII